MIQSKSIGSRIFNVFNVILMTLLSVSCIYPLWYAFCLSVSSKSAANSGLVTFYPVGFSLASYQQIMGDTQFFRSFLISVERTVLGTIVTMLILIIFAYPLSKPASEYRPKNVIMWIVIFCMLFNGGTIPWYITMVKYGLIDNIWGLVLCGGLPVFNLILLINFYRGIPKELIEAAQVDGANHLQVFWKIKWAQIKPTTLYILVITTINSFQCFALIQLLTSGGPNYSTSTVMYYLYEIAFRTTKEFGYADAMGVILAIVIALFSALQFKVMHGGTTE